MKTIKLLLFLLAVLAFSDTDLYASHITGGDIEYEYVGRDTTFGSNGQVLSISGPKYLVRVRLYRDCTGINIGSALLYITSSCYANRSISMTKIMGPLSSGNFEPPTYYDCVEPATVKCIELSIFADTIELDGLCADWRFYYSTCCRPPGIDNLQGSVGRGFYFEARLNNAFSENNSSPEFISTPARAFCVGNPFNWKQLVNEADGDSISFELSHCQRECGWKCHSIYSSLYVSTAIAYQSSTNVYIGSTNRVNVFHAGCSGYVRHTNSFK
jgi:hypothetical protein